jgi:hypothetical protein
VTKLLATKTNKYHEYNRHLVKINTNDRCLWLPDVTLQNMHIFLAILMQMGNVTDTLKHYRSTLEHFYIPFYSNMTHHSNMMPYDWLLHIVPEKLSIGGNGWQKRFHGNQTTLLCQQQLGHHYARACLTCHSTVEEFWETVLSVSLALRLHTRANRTIVESEVGSRKSEAGVGDYQSTVLSCNVRCCYQAMTSKDKEGLVFTAVICRVCRLVKVLQLLVVMSHKRAINSIINPTPVCSH